MFILIPRPLLSQRWCKSLDPLGGKTSASNGPSRIFEWCSKYPARYHFYYFVDFINPQRINILTSFTYFFELLRDVITTSHYSSEIIVQGWYNIDIQNLKNNMAHFSIYQLFHISTYVRDKIIN